MYGRSSCPNRAKVLAASLFVFAVIAAATSFRNMPLIAADEVGYLGIARYIATGSGPNMAPAAHYYFGGSLFMVPIMWAIEDPHIAYTAIVLLNAGFAIAFFLCCYQIARDFDVDPNISLVAALLTTFWPAYFFQVLFRVAGDAFSRSLCLRHLMCVSDDDAVRTAVACPVCPRQRCSHSNAPKGGAARPGSHRHRRRAGNLFAHEFGHQLSELSRSFSSDGFWRR